MRFDRQILLLIFLFGSAHCRPAPSLTTTAASSSTTSSDDDSPSLILDVSPQLISSVADFASEIVSAIFSGETSSTSRRTTRQALDKESSSSEPYPPVALQTTRIARSSNSKSVAVISSTANSRRIRTEQPPAQGTARDSSPAVSLQPTTTHRRPQATAHTSDEQDSSQGHTAYAHPTTIHAADTQPNSNSIGLNNTLARESELATMSGATTTAGGVGGLLGAIGQVGALSGSDTASATDLRPTTANSPTEPTNALDVLISALPTSVAAPIQSEYSDIIDPLNSGINRLTSDIFSAGESTAHTHTRPTRTPASNTPSTTTSLTLTSQSLTTTTTPTTTSTALPPPPSSTGDPMSTMQTRPSGTDNSAPAATTNNEAPTAANPSENASTVGIATGVASGVVLVALAGVYLWRRHQQGDRFSLFARNNSKRSNRVYPEVAWLYDPDITPAHSRSGSVSDAGQHLIPEPRPGSVEMAGTPVMGGASPEMQPSSRAGSPLLAPVVRGSRDMVGSRSRSGSEVDLERLRPLSAVREEGSRGGMS